MRHRFILIIILTSSCTLFGQQKQTDISEYFSESEVEGFNEIADFFQLQLCGTKDKEKFAKCFNLALPKLLDLDQNYIGRKISWKKQKKLYSKISDTCFETVWHICNSWRNIKPKHEYESICFGQSGVFLEFVQELGKTNLYLAYYEKKLKSNSTFDSGNYLVANINQNTANWNLNDRGVQVFLAIHFLTQNDALKRDKRATRLEKKDVRKLNRKNKTVPYNT